jgi:hypothetical protein
MANFNGFFYVFYALGLLRLKTLTQNSDGS